MTSADRRRVRPYHYIPRYDHACIDCRAANALRELPPSTSSDLYSGLVPCERHEHPPLCGVRIRIDCTCGELCPYCGGPSDDPRWPTGYACLACTRRYEREGRPFPTMDVKQ